MENLTQNTYEDATTTLYLQSNPPASANISSGIMFNTVHTSSYAINPLGRGLQGAYDSSDSYRLK